MSEFGRIMREWLDSLEEAKASVRGDGVWPSRVIYIPPAPTTYEVQGRSWPVGFRIELKKCECGATKAGSPRHSDYCDLYVKV